MLREKLKNELEDFLNDHLNFTKNMKEEFNSTENLNKVKYGQLFEK